MLNGSSRGVDLSGDVCFHGHRAKTEKRDTAEQEWNAYAMKGNKHWWTMGNTPNDCSQEAVASVVDATGGNVESVDENEGGIAQ